MLKWTDLDMQGHKQDSRDKTFHENRKRGMFVVILGMLSKTLKYLHFWPN